MIPAAVAVTTAVVIMRTAIAMRLAVRTACLIASTFAARLAFLARLRWTRETQIFGATVVLHLIAQLLHLAGKIAEFTLQLFNALSIPLRTRVRAMMLLLALGMLAHLARHLLNVFRGFIQSGGTEMLDGFSEVTELCAEITLAVALGVVPPLRCAMLRIKLRALHRRCGGTRDWTIRLVRASIRSLCLDAGAQKGQGGGA
jgi:hypothetical protein